MNVNNSWHAPLEVAKILVGTNTTPDACNVVWMREKLCFFFQRYKMSILQFSEYIFLLLYMVLYFIKTFTKTLQYFII